MREIDGTEYTMGCSMLNRVDFCSTAVIIIWGDFRGIYVFFQFSGRSSVSCQLISIIFCRMTANSGPHKIQS